MIASPHLSSRIRIGILLSLVFLLVLFAFQSNHAISQDIIDAQEVQAIMADQASEEPEASSGTLTANGIDLLELIYSGGGFMIPIAVMSLLVVALATERLTTLRRGKILPTALVAKLDAISSPLDRFNPGAAYQACLDHPSPAARVIASMLLRTGQPLGEIEKTATETAQREAETYASPIRWLNLAAAATPLMGLLGTVWGMIVAFHESTSLSADQSRSEQLSEGIYTALVTTLAGLVVAIPAAIFAQYLENRLIKLFHRVEQLAFDVAPGLVRFQGRQRLDPDGTLQAMAPSSAAAAPASAATTTPPTPPPPPASQKTPPPPVRSEANMG